MKYLIIITYGNGNRFPLEVEAESRADAMVKAATYCSLKGYEIININLMDLYADEIKKIG